MRYVVLIYTNSATWKHPLFLQDGETLSEQERADRVAQHVNLVEEIRTSGELLTAAALAAPAEGTRLSALGGVPSPTDGPFPDAKEYLAGVFFLECDSPERAAEIASRFPDAKVGSVEIRPVDEISEKDF
ncbi:YciI family protein [Micromonospora sp. DT43]|uniref:YciI family protein n=1 Tax=Micromonospora sp. DT43 TaxID=3393440 RepID=UPI003CF4655D